MRGFTGLSICVMLAVTTLLPADLPAKEKQVKLAKGQIVVWEPLTDSVWSVADSLRAKYHAVMLFEKIYADDRNAEDKEALLTVYQRIRIFSAEGRSWGDVTIPYLSSRQKFDGVQARVVLPTGDTTGFDPKLVIEKQVLKAKGIKIKQRAFSLPGVSDDCIVEFAYRLRSPANLGVWMIEKDIPLLSGELLWDVFRYKGYNEYASDFYSKYVVPNYVIMNANRPIDIAFLPSRDTTEQVRFRVANVAPFAGEPYSLPANYLRSQVRMYYGDRDIAATYWSDVANGLEEDNIAFLKDRGNLAAVAAQFDSTLPVAERAAAAYRWVQENIVNTSYRPSNDTANFDKVDASTAAKMLKHKVGSRLMINTLYWALLRAMKIPAEEVWVVDCDENLLVEGAKYWQFDRNIIMIPGDAPAKPTFYSPGDPSLPPGHVLWVNEGIKGLIAGADERLFVAIPNSPPADNRTIRQINLVLGEDQSLAGKYFERQAGQAAAITRLEYTQAATGERQSYLVDEIKNDLYEADIDSLTAESLQVNTAPLVMRANIQITEADMESAGSRLVLKPLKYLKTESDPFTAATRRHPVMFPYAYDHQDQIVISWPTGWKVESLPEQQVIRNSTGDCQVSFTATDTSVTVHRIFRLADAYQEKEEYAKLQKLYQAYARSSDIAVALTQTSQ